jgi:hypothetical protein
MSRNPHRPSANRALVCRDGVAGARQGLSVDFGSDHIIALTAQCITLFYALLLDLQDVTNTALGCSTSEHDSETRFSVTLPDHPYEWYCGRPLYHVPHREYCELFYSLFRGLGHSPSGPGPSGLKLSRTLTPTPALALAPLVRLHALEVIIAIRPVVGLFSIVVLLCAVILPFPTPSILEAHGKVVHRGSRSPLSSSDT